MPHDDLAWADLSAAGDPALVAWLADASCDPHVMVLVVAAVHACDRGVSAAQWVIRTAKAAGVRSQGRAAIAARTLRTDRWWAYPAVAFAVLLTFVAYATYAAIANCYYYRKACYRSWWLSPPACAVPEPHRRYRGETRAACCRHGGILPYVLRRLAAPGAAPAPGAGAPR